MVKFLILKAFSFILITTLIPSLSLVQNAAGQPAADAASVPQGEREFGENESKHPKFLELLREQAKQRKEFYEQQSAEKKSILGSQREQEQKLREDHRQLRSDISKEKLPRSARRDLVTKQREEMHALKLKFREEKEKMDTLLRQNLSEFLSKQKSDRRELLKQIGQSFRAK